jgi:hypothetical protein
MHLYDCYKFEQRHVKLTSNDCCLSAIDSWSFSTTHIMDQAACLNLRSSSQLPSSVTEFAHSFKGIVRRVTNIYFVDERTSCASSSPDLVASMQKCLCQKCILADTNLTCRCQLFSPMSFLRHVFRC